MSDNALKLLKIFLDCAVNEKPVPSMTELQQMLGFRSQAPLQSCLKRLIESGNLTGY